MSIHYQDDKTTIHHGDCLEVMADMPADSVDAIVTDPPYGLGFMGRAWDALPPGKEWAEECLRVLKPGGHLLAFGGSRTWHRLAVAIEDGGFEMRDSIAWLYGAGFPKSLNVSKAIDRIAGAEREVVGIGGKSGKARNSMAGDFAGEWDTTAPATPETQQWDGWGTALKPAFEPVVVARKPLEGTVAANVLEHGTGAINVDGCRIETDEKITNHARGAASSVSKGIYGDSVAQVTHQTAGQTLGRWPANVVLDESQAEALDGQTEGMRASKPSGTGSAGIRGGQATSFSSGTVTHRDESEGGASRFMYVAKAPKRERPNVDGTAHPTVKPLSLMQWLVRLVTPPGGTVLDPFAGSGTTIEAALTEGFNSIGIELTDEYLPLIQHRIERATETTMF